MIKDNILNYLDIAMASYSDNSTVENLDIVKKYNNRQTGVQYFIGRKDDKLVICFRGSDELSDWMNDFKFFKKIVPYGNSKTKIRIHTGFYDLYQTIRNDIKNFIFNEIHRSKNSVKNIDIIGHSLGSSLSLLCGIDLQFNYPEIHYTIITFGSPRVGNAAFVKSYNKRLKKTLRIENGNDIVTKLPFKFLGYKHVGIGIHIGLPRFFLWWSISAHECMSYYQRIWKLI